MKQQLNTEKRLTKVLIVDDSPTQAKLLDIILTAQGYHVSIARNGREAIDLITADKPDLVISDILMPEIDGFELCRMIRATEAVNDIPIILLTRLNDPADVLRSLEAGANYFISKPYDNQSLLALASRTLLNSRISRGEDDNSEVDVRYHGQRYSIRARKDQIIDLLLATYETAVEKNQELLDTQMALRSLNQGLEKRVNERTAALMAETTERLRASEALRDKEKLLIQQNRLAAMGEMINNIAHQWRQPLNTLGLTIQNSLLVYDIGVFDREFLKKNTDDAMKLIRHMSHTIDDFRNFFKADKEKTAFSVKKAIKLTLALIDNALKNNGIEIVTRINGDPLITGYFNEFSQVLLNVLQNASDVLVERKIARGKVTIAAAVEDGRALVTINDNAGGIPEEIIGRIFEPYFSTKGVQGTGIGLFMSKNIIETNMGGSITARNTAQGAEFRIEL